MAAQMGAQHLIGHRLLDREGNGVGKIGQVFFDDQTHIPKWVTVRTGLFGTDENFVPLRGAHTVDDALQVAYPKDQIKSAPCFAIDEHLSVYQEDMIYQHYDLQPEVPAQRSAEEQDWRPKGKHAKPPENTRGAGEPEPAGTVEYPQDTGESVRVIGEGPGRAHHAGGGGAHERPTRPGDDEPPRAS